MRVSPNSTDEKFAAFDFSEDDDLVENISRKRLSKFFSKPPKKSKFNSPMDKYNLLSCFTGQATSVKSNNEFEPIDVDASDYKLEEPTCRLDTSEKCSGKEGFAKSKSRIEPIDVDASDSKLEEPKWQLDVSVEDSVSGQAEFVKLNSEFELIDVDASDYKFEEPARRLDAKRTGSVSNDAINDIRTSQTCNLDVPVFAEHIGDQIAERITRLDNNVLSGLNPDDSIAKRSEDTVLDCKNSNIAFNLVDTIPISVDSDDDHSVENKLAVTDSKFSICGGLLGNEPSGVDAKLTVPERTVFVAPDYIFYLGTYSMEASLTFSSQGIRLEASNHFGAKRSIEVEWAISEIVAIESIQCGNLAEIILRFTPNDTNIVDATKIDFAVSDPNWAQRQESIRSLHWRYKFCWNVLLDSDRPSIESTAFQSSNQISDHYPAKKSKRVLVYPKGDPDPVSISERDIELLLPERFINDTIIDFYIKYISNRIRPPERQRFHFFNCFFFRKLADLDKDSSRVHDGAEAFQNVRKWTKNVDLFAKDFIFIPVNFSLHWSLIIICHPGEVTKSEDELQNSNKLPCILHMDSIRGSHRGFTNLFQSYLLEEWKERHIEAGNISGNFGRLPFYSLELPQQQNSFDCGLFLLHYVELFLEMTSVNPNAFNVAEPSSFPQRNWFPPDEASEKRVRIRKLIQEITERDPLEDPILEADIKYSISDESISTGSSLEKLDEREVPFSADPEFISDEGVLVTSRKDTPLKISHRAGKPGPVFDIQQEAQVVTDKLYELSTVEEDREVEGQMYPCTEEAQFQQSVATPYHVADSVEHTNVQECEMLASSPTTPTCLLSESENLISDEDDVPCILVALSREKENHVYDLELESYVIDDSEVED